MLHGANMILQLAPLWQYDYSFTRTLQG